MQLGCGRPMFKDMSLICPLQKVSGKFLSIFAVKTIFFYKQRLLVRERQEPCRPIIGQLTYGEEY